MRRLGTGGTEPELSRGSVQQRPEHARRVGAGRAQPLDRAVRRDQAALLAVGQEGIVRNGRKCAHGPITLRRQQAGQLRWAVPTGAFHDQPNVIGGRPAMSPRPREMLLDPPGDATWRRCKRMDHKRQKPRVTSPVQVPSVTCDLAAINVEDLAGDVGDDPGNRMPSTTSLTWPTRPRGPVAECVAAFRRVHRRLDHAFGHIAGRSSPEGKVRRLRESRDPVLADTPRARCWQRSPMSSDRP